MDAKMNGIIVTKTMAPQITQLGLQFKLMDNRVPLQAPMLKMKMVLLIIQRLKILMLRNI
jgi:hypothetical protein